MSKTIESFGSLIVAFALAIAVTLGFASPARAADSVTIVLPSPGENFGTGETIQVLGTATGSVVEVELCAPLGGNSNCFDPPKPVINGGWSSLISFGSPGNRILRAQGLDENGYAVGSPAGTSISIR